MNTKRTLERTLIVISVLLIFVTVQARQGMTPVYTPTGPYQVGVTSRQWVDESRAEIYTADLNDNKGVTVWIWYPADVEDGTEMVPYVEHPETIAFLDVLAPDFGMTPADLREFVASSQAAAYQDAPVAAAMAQYPVVIYFDPISGLPINQGAQMQELASHGYVVVSILHASGFEVSLGEHQFTIGDASFDYSFVDWTANALPDVFFVIDQLEVLNQEPHFADRLDLENIGLSGYSLGGTIAAHAAAQDDRIKAAISQDGLPAAFDYSTIELPYMILQAEGDFASAYEEFTGPTYLVASDRLTHAHFADYLLWPHGLDLPEGIADGIRGAQIINAYVIAFFDQYLKGEDQELLQGPSDDFLEVTIQSRNLDG